MSIDFSNFKSALKTLKAGMEILNKNKDTDLADMLEDSCIKRFEYTLEIARKLMKKVLKKVYGKSEEELTVNNVFRFMQGYGFIQDWENWRKKKKKRNNTAHEYNLEKSRKLVEIIPEFIKDADFLSEKFDEIKE